MVKRSLMLGALLVAFSALAATGALANSSSDNATNWSTTETLTVYYNSTTCAGTGAYQIYQVSAKWVRPDLNKEVEADNYDAGEAGGPLCSGGFANYSDNTAFSFSAMNVWSCPDAFHSCPVSRSYSWDYQKDSTYSVEGANINGEIHDRSLGNLGWLCTHVYFQGNGGCS